MQTTHHERVRGALLRLADTSVHASTDGVTHLRLLRAPSIAVLWIVSLLAVTALLALGRVRVPHNVRGAVVAVRDEASDVALILLLPASERRFIASGQRASLTTGGPAPVTLPLSAAEAWLLDADEARRRFPDAPSVLAQLDAPKVAVRLAPCGPARCLTPRVGDTYAATALLGTRSLASYVLSRS